MLAADSYKKDGKTLIRTLIIIKRRNDENLKTVPVPMMVAW